MMNLSQFCFRLQIDLSLFFQMNHIIRLFLPEIVTEILVFHGLKFKLSVGFSEVEN